MSRASKLALVLYLVGATWSFLTEAAPEHSEYQTMTIRDPDRRLIWLRCSIGQHWNGKTCLGEPAALTFEQAQRSAVLARSELAGEWRLPSIQELEGLVCRTCAPVRINNELFPRSALGAYWSESPNTLNSDLYWSVSFQNGFSFGRNPPELAHFVRLVRSFTVSD